MHDHPHYRRLKNQQLVFDVSLLETVRNMAPFGKDLRPICLPPSAWWRESFAKEYVMESAISPTNRCSFTVIHDCFAP